MDKLTIKENWGPVHTYPDIFESATFSFRIKKFSRPHVTDTYPLMPLFYFTLQSRIKLDTRYLTSDSSIRTI